MLKITRLLFFVGFLICAFLGFTQNKAFSANTIERLKLFIEGDEIEGDDDLTFSYIRESINFADFVNDPKSADVQIIVIKEITGGGGFSYSVWFNSLTLKNINGFTLNVNTMSGETVHNTRELIQKTIIRGLMPFLNEVNDGEKYELSLNEVKNGDVGAINDKWNYWVFKLRATGGFDYEENIRGYNYSGTFFADKVTDNLKINNYVYVDNRVTNYLASNYKYIYNYKYAYSKVVLSINEHWSAGATVFGYQSTPVNTRFAISCLPAIEYNVFPWTESNKRELTFTYTIGNEYRSYYEMTRFDKMKENIAVHKLYITARIIQPWGEVAVNVAGTEYLHDFSLYNVSFGSDFSFRISKGLSVTFDFLAKSVHNQIYLSKKSFSDADIITEAVKLPSTIELNGSIGITYQFGSIYNNVVNRRM